MEGSSYGRSSRATSPPTAPLDPLAESIIKFVRLEMEFRAQASRHSPGTEFLSEFHPIKLGACSGYLSIHSGINLCRISIGDKPIPLKAEYGSFVSYYILRRCLQVGRFEIYVTRRSIEIKRSSKDGSSGSRPCTAFIQQCCNDDSLSPLEPTEILRMIVCLLDEWASGFNELLTLGSKDDDGGSRASGIRRALTSLHQMKEALIPAIQTPGEKRKRCLTGSEDGDVCMKDVDEDRKVGIGFLRERGEHLGLSKGLPWTQSNDNEDVEEYSEIFSKMKRLRCS